MSSEICTFVKCIVCMFSCLVTPILQTYGPIHKYRPFFNLSNTLLGTASLLPIKEPFEENRWGCNDIPYILHDFIRPLQF